MKLFNGRVIKSSDNTQMISSYDKAVKIAKDESKVHPLDVNTIELEKKVKINNHYPQLKRITDFVFYYD
ncbi:MAG: hypothetical protein Q4G33_02265, partial [bacterium]|nr:hypothetical protein [bacterium]